MMTTRILILTAVLFALASTDRLHSEIIAIEDFEDSTVSYIASFMDDLSDIDSRDYFGRIAPDTASPPTDVAYSNFQGAGYYGVQDSDSVANNGVDTIRLDWFGIDASRHTNLNLAWFVAEDDASDGREDWDAASEFTIAVQLDGGGYVDVFQVASENVEIANGSTGDQLNERPRVDTDFNGVGDGAEITDIFTQFNVDLAAAETVDIRATFTGLDSGDEDFALDHVVLSGDVTAVPEPSTSVMFLAISFGISGRRRRHR